MSCATPSFGKGSIYSSEAMGPTGGGSGQERIACWENSRRDGALMGSSPTCAPAH